MQARGAAVELEFDLPLDYHVEYDQHFYSVPYQLVKQAVHAGQTSVAIMHQGKQAALHPRSYHKGGHSTDSNHMAKAHRKHQQWSPQRLLEWAAEVGPPTCVKLTPPHQILTITGVF